MSALGAERPQKFSVLCRLLQSGITWINSFSS